jgi:hypothetical protein
MSKFLIPALLGLCFFTSSLRAQQSAGVYFVTVANTTDTQEEERLINALAKAGFNCLPAPDPSGNGMIHVQVGPYTSQAEMDSARSRLLAAGYKLPGEVTSTPGGLTSQQASLEAQALANLGGGTAPGAAATGSDLEAQALANLGGGAPSGPPATGADLEAQALQSMKTNEIEAERQRQLALQREQEEQAEQARQAADEADQQASEPQTIGTSSGGGFLNALNGVLGVVNDGLDAQIAQQNARNAQLQAQMNAQVAANNARREREAEQQREQAAQERQLAEQRREAQQQRESQQQAVASQASNNSKLCNSARSPEALIADGCAGSGAGSNTAQSRSGQQVSQQQTAAVSKPLSPGFSAPTGTAAPANCVYLSDAQPCVPLDQYAQMQSQKQASGPGICPASDFVPGVMFRQESDVAVGVPCKPGTPYGPLIATTSTGGYTGVTPPDSSGSATSTGAGNGGSSSSGTWTNKDGYDDAMNQCITISHKPDPIVGDYMTFTNSCTQNTHVFFYVSSQIKGGDQLSAGATDRIWGWPEVLAAGNHVSIYACPVTDTPKTSTGGFAPDGPDQLFRCARP